MRRFACTAPGCKHEQRTQVTGRVEFTHTHQKSRKTYPMKEITT